MDIHVDVKEEEGKTVVFISGEIDVYTSPKLRRILIPLSKENNHLLLDLTNVSYMDSTGLGVIVAAFKNSRENEGQFSLTGLSERLERLFTITGLAEIMVIKSNLKGEAE